MRTERDLEETDLISYAEKETTGWAGEKNNVNLWSKFSIYTAHRLPLIKFV